MKKIKVFLMSLILNIALIACTPHYDAATISQVKPCMDMGYSIDQCVATYRQFGHDYSNNNEWINYAAAFAAGAAANHWWNRQPSYSYNPSYWDTHPRQNITINKTYINQQSSTIGKNLANSPSAKPSAGFIEMPKVEAPKSSFKPIMVQPPQQAAKSISSLSVKPSTTFKPISVAPPKSSSSSSSTFKPIRVTPSKSSTSSSKR